MKRLRDNVLDNSSNSPFPPELSIDSNSGFVQTFDKISSESVISLTDIFYGSERRYEKEINSNRWILFLPDYPDLPIVVTDWTLNILNQFDGRRTVHEVINSMPNTGEALSNVAYFVNSGYLRLEKSQLPYKPTYPNSVVPKVVEVWLHITNNCNLQCKYCFVETKDNTKITPNTASQIIEMLAATAERHNLQKLTIKFAGGEPTLALPLMNSIRSEFDRKFQDKSTELRFAVLTNGTILNEEFLSFVSRSDTSITISIDGFKDAHDTYRVFRSSGSGSWDKIIQNIEVLKKHSIHPFINATISRDTCQSLPDLIKWVHDNGFNSRLNIVRQPDCSWLRTSCTQTAYKNYIDNLTIGFSIAFEELCNPKYSFQFVSKIRIGDLHFENPVEVPCGIGFNHIVIKPNGRIVSCPMNVDEIGIDPGIDILESSQTFKQFYSLDHEKERDCLYCRWFPVCAGGCPVTNSRINGNPYSKSPLCEFYCFIIPAYIDLLGKKMIQEF